MARHLQYNDDFTEAEITGLTAIPERNIGDIYEANDTGNIFEIKEDLTPIPYERVDNSVPPDPTNPPYYKATGSVLSDGTLEQGAGATITRFGVGQYDITFNSVANTATYPVLATMQALPQNDDYQWAYLNRTISGFRIEIREQDNGGAAGILRDSGFSFFVPII